MKITKMKSNKKMPFRNNIEIISLKKYPNIQAKCLKFRLKWRINRKIRNKISKKCRIWRLEWVSKVSLLKNYKNWMRIARQLTRLKYIKIMLRGVNMSWRVLRSKWSMAWRIWRLRGCRVDKIHNKSKWYLTMLWLRANRKILRHGEIILM